MTLMHWRLSLVLPALVLGGGALLAADPQPAPATKPAKEAVSFGVLETVSADAARAQSLEWLKSVGKDAANQKAFDDIWASDRSLLEKVGDSLALGDADAAQLLTDARDPFKPAPLSVPAVFKDAKKPAFFRANLALAYAKALGDRKIYEEGLGALKLVKAEEVVDPGAYLFTRAVAEYSLLQKAAADQSILRLLDDVPDAPERYKMVATLMHFDMISWKEKDLGWVARMMNNIERRLDLSRGGPQTQDMQKKVVLQLDEMIKKLEDEQNQQSSSSSSGGQKSANGRPQGAITPSSPAQDDYLNGPGGPGNVDKKRWTELAKNWGSLPEKDKVKAMQELTHGMPARHRELIENYFKNLAKSETPSSR